VPAPGVLPPSTAATAGADLQPERPAGKWCLFLQFARDRIADILDVDFLARKAESNLARTVLLQIQDDPLMLHCRFF
jgi:hypothetical protein